MSPARLLRVLLLAAALLSAQHAALAHAIWHSAGHKSQPAQKSLCLQHDALGTVAGAVDAAIVIVPTEAAVAPEYRSLVPPAAKSPGLAPSSRGPPASL